VKERLVICNEKDTEGRARVTTDEERVLPVDRLIKLQCDDFGTKKMSLSLSPISCSCYHPLYCIIS